MFSAHLRTRSTTRDYRWLGDPPEEWWLDPSWGNSLLRLDPVLLIDGSDEGPRILATGIASGRVDQAGTRIRYELAFESKPDGELSVTDVMAFVDRWMSSHGTAGSQPWDLGLSIDSAFGGRKDQGARTILDDLVGADDDSQVAQVLQDVAGNVSVAVMGAPLPDPPDPEAVRWVGLDSDWSPWLIQRAVHGAFARGLAYFSGLAPEDVDESLTGVAPLVLVAGDRGVHERKKAQPSARAEQGQPSRRQAKPWSCVLVLLVLLVALTAGTAAAKILLA